MRKRWDGLFVCKEDYEIKHPQLSLKVRGDKQQVPIPRPESTDQFLEFCDVWKSSGYSDLATADCARADNNNTPYTLLIATKSTQVG